MKTKELIRAGYGSIQSMMDQQDTLRTGDLTVASSALTSLVGCPDSLPGAFSCGWNNLTSLKGGPSHVGGNIYVGRNKLRTLKYFPNYVGGNINVSDNNLTSLKGLPNLVNGDLRVSINKIKSLEGVPSSISRDFWCSYNNLTSLEGIHKHIKHIGGHAYFDNNPIKSHVLGLLRISGLQSVVLGTRGVERIINKYLEGDRDIFACQEELVNAGLEKFAKL